MRFLHINYFSELCQVSVPSVACVLVQLKKKKKKNKEIIAMRMQHLHVLDLILFA